MRFKGKVVLVTGAVRNTGLAIAEAFAEEGAKIALNGRKGEDVERVAAMLREKFGATVFEATADVADPEQVDAMFAKIKSEFGRLDILVNNAILQGVGHSFTDTPLELLNDVFAVNVFGAFHCAREAAKMMVEQGFGSIVNVGSNTSEQAIGDRTAYIASKGAIDALTRAMAVDLGPKGVRVNNVAAGYIHTDRWESLTKEKERRRANIPLGAEASGREIADAILFMASDAASKITGTRLLVDGGVSSQLVPADCDM